MKANKKEILICPHCKKKLRYPTGKHIRFTCPNCNTPYEVIPDEDGQTIINALNLSQKEIQDCSFSNEDVENGNWTFKDWLLYLLCLLLFFPLFIFLHRILPNPDWKFNLDRILLGAGTFIIINILIYYLRIFTLSTLGIIVAMFTFGSIFGKKHYGWDDFFLDYKATKYALLHEKKKVSKEHILLTPLYDTLSPYPVNITSNIEDTYKEAIDYYHPEVRNYALKCLDDYSDFKSVIERFPNYRKEIQACALCKHINSHWDYVYDPINREYIAKASESVHHLRGDCEDHAIFMAACLKAIGCDVRIILSIKHAYPEMKVAKKDFEKVQYLIEKELFEAEIEHDDPLYYHIDSIGDYWLNLDYTNYYPGSPFLGTDTILRKINI